MINGCRDIRETIDMSIDTVDLDFDNYYENYLKLVERMEKIYPNQPFSLHGIKNKHPPPTQFVIDNKDRRHITYRDFYDAVVKNWDTTKTCDHSLLETIDVRNNCIELFLSA